MHGTNSFCIKIQYGHAYVHVLIQKLGGKKLTKAIFNLTMCDALLFFYSTVFVFKLSIIYYISITVNGSWPAFKNSWFDSWFEVQRTYLQRIKYLWSRTSWTYKCTYKNVNYLSAQKCTIKAWESYSIHHGCGKFNQKKLGWGRETTTQSLRKFINHKYLKITNKK